MRSLNGRVEALVQKLTGEGQELGLQVAAYVGEELVVDAWAGLADEATGRAVNGDTLFTTWSVTKGISATLLHILVDRGRAAYDDPVSRWWPEFASNGKSEVTLRHVLTHTVGIPRLPEGVAVEDILDWHAMCRYLADQTPLWPPGKQFGYHAWTFGWMVGEIIRRADGRPIPQFLKEELCDPLSIEDLYLGTPDDVEGRVAVLKNGTPPPGNTPSELYARTIPPSLTNALVFNDPRVRRAALPGVGGIMNARAVARHYALLANGGRLKGRQLLSPQRIDAMREFIADAPDAVLGLRLRRGLGYYLGGEVDGFGDDRMGTSGREFGHPGMGGSIGFADPARKLAIGITKNLVKSGEERTSTAAYQICELIRNNLTAA